jgi:hypothetical protein
MTNYFIRQYAKITRFSVLRYCTIIFAFLFFALSQAQQVPDNNYSPPTFIPKYVNDLGSVVVIDEAHNNFHTLTGRYAPFARVLKKDGYKIIKGTEHFSKKNLEKGKILVIANAINAANIKQWTLPTPSAFTSGEIEIVKDWVKNGGSLFLIADHMPFAGAATDLAKAFGFIIYNGFAIDQATYMRGLPDIFIRSDNTFQPTGLPGLEFVNSIATFMGNAFSIPADAVSIVNLDERFKIFLPAKAWEFDKSTVWISGKGKSQGAYMRFGKGHLVIFGEAAMFSAQISNNNKIGMNTPEGENNYLLLLSIIHWLDDTN